MADCILLPTAARSHLILVQVLVVLVLSAYAVNFSSFSFYIKFFMNVVRIKHFPPKETFFLRYTQNRGMSQNIVSSRI